MKTVKQYRPITGSPKAQSLRISNDHQQSASESQSTPLKVIGCVDQFAKEWLAVRQNGKLAFARRDLLSADDRAFYTALGRQSVIIKSAAKRRAIEHVAEDGPFSAKIYVIDRLGWHARFYVWPGRSLPKLIKGRRVVDALGYDESRWSTRGSLEDWKRGLVSLQLSRHTLPTFALAAAFASLVQNALARSDNSMIEFVSSSSVGKSTLLRLAATLFGDPEQFVRRWDTTAMGVENLMRASNHGLLLLDELGLFLAAGADRVRQVGLVVLKLADGVDRERKNEPSQKKRFRLLALSSGNTACHAAVSRVPDVDQDAIRVRMVTLPVVGGIFDGLVNDDNSASLMGRVEAFCRTQYGHAGPAFVQRIERKLAEPDGAKTIRAMLHDSVKRFLEQAAVLSHDWQGRRICRKFADVYAGAELARVWGLFPISSHALLGAILRAWRLHQAQRPEKPRSAAAQLHDYVTRNRDRLYRLNGQNYLELDTAALDSHAGFLLQYKGHSCLLIRRERLERTFGTRADPILSEMQNGNRLIATDGKQVQIRVRKNSMKDRMYCFVLK